MPMSINKIKSDLSQPKASFQSFRSMEIEHARSTIIVVVAAIVMVGLRTCMLGDLSTPKGKWRLSPSPPRVIVVNVTRSDKKRMSSMSLPWIWFLSEKSRLWVAFYSISHKNGGGPHPLIYWFRSRAQQSKTCDKTYPRAAQDNTIRTIRIFSERLEPNRK